MGVLDVEGMNMNRLSKLAIDGPSDLFLGRKR